MLILIFLRLEANHPITIMANSKDCHFQFDPIGKAKFLTACDIAKSTLAKKGVSYKNSEESVGNTATISILGIGSVSSFDGTALSSEDLKIRQKAFEQELSAKLTEAGYPSKANPENINYPMVILILSILVIYVTMVYGPIAAYLVEMFPTRIRYTSMSLPYHIGNGWFGGFLPTIAFAMVAMSGDIYYGLWYPIVIALGTAVIGFFALPETKNWDLDHHD